VRPSGALSRGDAHGTPHFIGSADSKGLAFAFIHVREPYNDDDYLAAIDAAIQ
jgi:hypothetical protein